MKVGEQIEKIIGCDEEVSKYMGYNHLGSFLNFMSASVDELGDNDIQDKYEELIELIQTKRKEIWEKEIN